MSVSRSHPLVRHLPERLNDPPKWEEPFLHDDVTVRPFRLNTFRWKNEAISTYGLYGEPVDASKIPGILHIHGGGQTASPDQVAYWVKRGYACVSLDWSGLVGGRKPEFVSAYPDNFPTRELTWYEQIEKTGDIMFPQLHGLIAGQRLLDLLTAQSNVDSKSLAAYGISWGGFLTWLINSVDDRLSAACAIYGTGGLHWPGHIWNAQWAKVGNQSRRMFTSLIEPRAHVPFQHAPITFLNGTNDFFGGLDVASEMLPMLPVDWRTDYCPNSDHHLSEGSVRLMEQWFDHHLRDGAAPPPLPELSADIQDDGSLLIRTNADPKTVELWYSEGTRPHADRAWRVLTEWQTDNTGASIKRTFGENVWLFVRQRHADGQCVCSAPICLSTKPRPIKFESRIWKAPSRDSLGIQGSTQPEMAGDLETLYELTDTALQTREVCGELSVLLLVAPENQPNDTVRTLHIELENTVTIEITAKANNVDWTVQHATEPTDTSIRLSCSQFKQADDTETKLSFAQVQRIFIKLKSLDGKCAKLKSVSWQS